MKIKKHKALSPSLFFFLLLVPTSTFSFMYYPLTGAKVIGSDGYLAIPVAFLFTIPLLLIATYFSYRYPGLTIIEYTPLVLGKFLGMVCNLLYLAVYFMLTVILLRDAIGLAYSFLLNRTPFFFINILMVGAALYLSYYGISSTARLASFLLPAIVFLGLMIFLSYQNWQVINVLPLCKQPLYTYIRGGALSLYVFYPLGLLFQAAAFTKRRKKIFSLSLLVLALVSGFYFLNFLGITGVFTAEGLTRYLWPNLEFVRTISFPFALFDDVGLILLVAWGVLAYSSTTILFFFLAHGLSQLTLKPGNAQSVASYQRILVVLGLITVATIQSIPNLDFLRARLNLFQIISGLILFGLSFLLLLTSLTRRYFARGKNNE